MKALDQQAVEQALDSYCLPYSDKNIISTRALSTISIDDQRIAIAITLGFPAASLLTRIQTEIEQCLQSCADGRHVEVSVQWKIDSHAVQQGLSGIAGVKNIIAVASGKGGVGKSTTAVNVALALLAEGARVGILDADIYGPSQPHLLGIQQKPESVDGKSFEPIVKYGLQSMSIGYLVDQETAMVWRGPMVTGALQQLINDTRWQDLDYLIVDLPPGTGDIQLTLAQKIPLSGSVVVTTPQDLALLDVRRAIGMFSKVNVPILGVIENMALHTCSACGHEEAIFGEAGAEKIAEQYNSKVLGRLPLDMRIRRQADQGEPIVLADAESDIAQAYSQIALALVAGLAQQQKNYSGRFPNIVVEQA